MGCLLGQAATPGLATVFGGTIVLVGLAVVVIGNDAREKKTAVTLTPALRQRTPGPEPLMSDGAATFTASPSGTTAAAFLISTLEAPPTDIETSSGAEDTVQYTRFGSGQGRSRTMSH